jgi:hypothetical protein
MGFRAKAGGRPCAERRADAFERGQLRAAAFAYSDVRVERRPLDHIEPALIAVEIRDDRLFPIA